MDSSLYLKDWLINNNKDNKNILSKYFLLIKKIELFKYFNNLINKQKEKEKNLSKYIDNNLENDLLHMFNTEENINLNLNGKSNVNNRYFIDDNCNEKINDIFKEDENFLKLMNNLFSQTEIQNGSIEKNNLPQKIITSNNGEKAVYNYLKKKRKFADIQWINEYKETGKPYDLLYTNKETNAKIYIEVKSTINSYEKSEKSPIYISSNQWKFMKDLNQEDKYIIGRVFEANSENPYIEFMEYKNSDNLF